MSMSRLLSMFFPTLAVALGVGFAAPAWAQVLGPVQGLPGVQVPGVGLPQLPGAPPLSRIDTLLHQSLAVTRQLQIDTLLRDESRRVDVDPHGAPILRGEFLAMGLSDAQRNTLRALGRSEEHTSELQSLMRTSYAVFCLKKKQNQHLYSLITMPIPINTQH